MSWDSLRLQDHVGLAVEGEMPSLPPALEAEVSAIWMDERSRRPSLFNGRVFCADRIAPDRITGHWTEYRRVLAQMRRPELFDRLRVRSLAVNGLLECTDGLLLGRRHQDAVYLAGCWQAAPAGAVEARRSGHDLDLTRQLLEELREELGLEAGDIVQLRPLAAIEHAGTHVVDVGFLLRTPLSFADVAARHRSGGNAEYDRLQRVALAEIDRFLQAAGPTLLPSARILMQCRQG